MKRQTDWEILKEDWEFLKEELGGIKNFIRWDHVILYLSVMLFCWGVLESAWGLLLGYVICNLFQNLCGGLNGDFLDIYPYEEPKKLPCSAGIEDCKICGDGYEHEFNERYDKEHNKWYNLF